MPAGTALPKESSSHHDAIAPSAAPETVPKKDPGAPSERCRPAVSDRFMGDEPRIQDHWLYDRAQHPHIAYLLNHDTTLEFQTSRLGNQADPIEGNA
jgi:hypothetical protein